MSQDRFEKLRQIPWSMAFSIGRSPVAVVESMSCTDRTAQYILTCLLFWDDFAQLADNQLRADALLEASYIGLMGMVTPDEDAKADLTMPERIFLAVADFLAAEGRCEHVQGKTAYMLQKILYWFMALRNGQMFHVMEVSDHRSLDDFVDCLIQAELQIPEPEDLPE